MDLYLIHWPNRSIRLEDTFQGLNKLLRAGKIRHMGVSNFDLELLKEAQALADSPLLTNQVPMSIFDTKLREERCSGVLPVESNLDHGILAAEARTSFAADPRVGADRRQSGSDSLPGWQSRGYAASRGSSPFPCPPIRNISARTWRRQTTY